MLTTLGSVGDGADGAAGVAGVAAAAVGFGAVAHAAGYACQFLDDGGAPVVAKFSEVFDCGVLLEGCGGKEDGLFVRTSHEVAVHSILVGEFPVAYFYQFAEFIFGRHSPSRAPIDGGCVVFGSQDAVFVDYAGFLQFFERDFVGEAVDGGVVVFWRCLAPCEVVASFFGCGGTDIGGGPAETTWKA